MTALLVVFSRRAARDVERIDVWWRANRPGSQDLFLSELRRSLAVLALSPGIGTRALSERTPGLRRVLLERTRYHVYFRVSGERLEVAAVWHASRGSLPAR
jgi:plasmid stabilization system protein ParE